MNNSLQIATVQSKLMAENLLNEEEKNCHVLLVRMVN